MTYNRSMGDFILTSKMGRGMEIRERVFEGIERGWDGWEGQIDKNENLFV